MHRLYITIILLLFTSFCFAQFKLTGTVINLTDKKPVVKASIFLSNTTVGSATGDDGSYTLFQVKPGQYDLIVTSLGFENYRQTIKIEKDTILPSIELLSKSISLKEIVVKPDAHWEDNYIAFREDFLGPSPFAAECRILNPDVLNLDYDITKKTLSASSYDYLEIENKALGYKLKYLLNEFTNDRSTGYLYFEGNVLFEEMTGSAAQKRRWAKNREDSYLGSSQQYMRSLITKTTVDEGFKTLRLVRKPNPDKPPDSLIQAKLKKFREMAANRNLISDSISYWAKMNRLPKTISYLVNQPLRVDSITKRTDQTGIFALGFDDFLYVMYTKKRDASNQVFRPLDVPNYMTTILEIIDPYIYFDSNGIIANPSGVMLEGAWAKERAASLLPIDYNPPIK